MRLIEQYERHFIAVAGRFWRLFKFSSLKHKLVFKSVFPVKERAVEEVRFYSALVLVGEPRHKDAARTAVGRRIAHRMMALERAQCQSVLGDVVAQA